MIDKIAQSDFETSEQKDLLKKLASLKYKEIL